jgi:hypothetical protein
MSRQFTDIGRLVATRPVTDTMTRDQQFNDFVRQSLRRYLSCDWGDLGAEDKQMNEDAIKGADARILGRYNHTAGDIYIITEWNHSYTTILFTTDY